MKTFMKMALFCSLVIPFSVQADDMTDACKPVFEACAAQGYSKDETAAAGQKIWLNCANVILNENKVVAKVDIDLKGFDVKNCRDYREARNKFDADWAKNHKKPKTK